MRRFGVAVILMAVAQTAQAADLPDLTDLPILRGGIRDGLSRTNSNWAGFYVGGQYGVSSNNFGMLGAASALSALAANTSQALDSGITGYQAYQKNTSQGFGGFAGYNAQWTDAVLGVDVNYNVGGQQSSFIVDPSPKNLTTGGSTYNTITTGASTMKITDYGSARLRAGWAVSAFLPYATVGFAMGRADLSRTVNATGTVDSGGGPLPFSISGTETKPGALLYGYSYGGGLDVSLFAGLFLRAEVEVTRFTSTWGMDATVTSARAGAGFKF